MLHQNGANVYRQSYAHTSLQSPFFYRNGERWYWAPDTLHYDKPRIAGKEVLPGIFRSIRSSNGWRYDANCLNIAIPILDLLESHGLQRIQVIIRYKDCEICYETTTTAFRVHGQYQPYAGGQISLARPYWTVDGQPITNPDAKQVVPQVVVLDFADQQKVAAS